VIIKIQKQKIALIVAIKRVACAKTGTPIRAKKNSLSLELNVDAIILIF